MAEPTNKPNVVPISEPNVVLIIEPIVEVRAALFV
jgi:hypothetical protein